MKKLLILAYDFPPYISVGGLRPYNWYKYLHEYGVYPVVITRQWSNKYGSNLDYIASSDSKQIIIEKTEFGTIIKTPYFSNLPNRLMLKYGDSRHKFIRRLFSAFYEFGQFLFIIGPKRRLYYAALEYLNENKVDAIIASGDPFILFSYASKISKKYNIPWIADYRDPWSQTVPVQRNFLLKIWTTHFERKIVKNVAAITTVLDLFKVRISKLFVNKKIYIIPNGYDPEAIDKIREIKQQSHVLSIAFVGTIERYHPVRIFLSAVSVFINNTNNARLNINFYGINTADEIQEMIKLDFPELKQQVHIYPKMPNNLLLQHLAKDNLMLLFNYYSNIGTKIYDYIAVKRTILLCFSNDKDADKLKDKYYHILEENDLSSNKQEELILKTSAGYIVKDAEHLVVMLELLYKEFSEKGYISCNTIDAEKYSRKNQTKFLADVVENISKEILLPVSSSAYEKKVYREYQQCNRCVMDTSDPDITFDENGNCNHCNNYVENISNLIYKGKETEIKFKQLVEKIKKKGKDNSYDCIVGISGGVDSIYTAYLAKKAGLRPLAVHMDNGWNSELAVSNIEKTLKKLNIELYTSVINWEEFRNLQLAFLKASVIEAETPTDIAIPAVLHKVASQYNVKYIFSGGNYATEGILPKYWHYNAKDIRYLKAISKKFGIQKLKTIPTFGFQKEMYYKIVKKIKMIYPLNYVPYNKQNAIEFLEQELNWKNYGGKHHESVYTKFVQSYILPVKFNIDYRRATFSTQICTAEITRDEALKELKKLPYDVIEIEEEKKYICKKLAISIEEFDEILKLPPKSFRDYPNNEKRLEYIYKVYRKLNK